MRERDRRLEERQTLSLSLSLVHRAGIMFYHPCAVIRSIPVITTISSDFPRRKFQFASDIAKKKKKNTSENVNSLNFFNEKNLNKKKKKKRKRADKVIRIILATRSIVICQLFALFAFEIDHFDRATRTTRVHLFNNYAFIFAHT